MKPLQTFHIITLGCPKNEVDSSRMEYSFLKSGFRPSESAEDADLIVINSCSFIRDAKEETIETIFDALDIKKKKKDARVALVGCFAERYEEETKAEIPDLDLIVGTGKYDAIGSLIREKFPVAERPTNLYAAGATKTKKNSTAYAWFRIASGCSRSCAFCIIPSIRGSLTPYSQERIREEWQKELELRDGSIPAEVILISQDTISQGLDELKAAVEFFSNIPEVRWIRMQYLFPDKRILPLLDFWREYPKLVPYLDIPFQHTHPDVLKRMKRPTNVSLFHQIMEKAREVRPDMEIRTSFIVGFPGESVAEHEALYEFLRETQVDKLALFRYSHEEGTPAGRLYEDDIAEEEKIERVNALRDFHLQNRTPGREQKVDRVELMLLENITENDLVFRRAQDAPEIDELVYVEKPDDDMERTVGGFYSIKLSYPMEIDWAGEFVE